MKKIRQLSLFTFLCLGAIFSLPTFAQDESIVLDPDTGNYIITFRSTFPSRELHRVVFVPATKIDPTVKSKFKLTSDQHIRYEYKVKNGPNSKQPLIGLRFIASKADRASQVAPKGWRASMIPNIVDTRVRVNWGYEELEEDASAGLQPGRNQSGFSVGSPDLPGIDVVRLNGASPVFGVPDEGPAMDSEVGKQLNQLTANDFVPRHAAIPLIPVPNPFDAAAVLTSMQKHVNQDMVSMNLIDPAFAPQLDRLFQTAIAAAKGGNTVALKGNLKDLRQMLKREHADVDQEDDDWDKDGDRKDKEKDKSRLIDKLAAKVLDFDLKYIQKRLGDND